MALASALAIWLAPPVADANFVYWTNQAGTTLGRAKLNGSGVNNSFITGLDDPKGVAVDAKFIYWAQGSATTGTIGRANLDGSGANPNFIPHSAGISNPSGIAVTSGAGLYWANGATTIGHANLDGSSPVSNFITAPGATFCGLAADQSFLYGLDSGLSRIGRAPLDGSSTIPNFVPGITTRCGVAVDGGFIYWGSNGTGVGRATIGGGSPTDNFIPGATTGGPCGVAVNPQYVFWGNTDGPPNFVGRANLSGSGANPALIAGPTNPCLLAAAPSNKITFTSTTLNKKKGTASLGAKVPGPGQVLLSDSTGSASAAGSATVKAVGVTLTAAGSFKLAVKPKGKASKSLKKKGKAKVKFTVTFTPSGVAGVANTQKRNLKLIKKRKRK